MNCGNLSNGFSYFWQRSFFHVFWSYSHRYNFSYVPLHSHFDGTFDISFFIKIEWQFIFRSFFLFFATALRQFCDIFQFCNVCWCKSYVDSFFFIIAFEHCWIFDHDDSQQNMIIISSILILFRWSLRFFSSNNGVCEAFSLRLILKSFIVRCIWFEINSQIDNLLRK